jgi:hypothetical protein
MKSVKYLIHKSDARPIDAVFWEKEEEDYY